LSPLQRNADLLVMYQPSTPATNGHIQPLPRANTALMARSLPLGCIQEQREMDTKLIDPEKRVRLNNIDVYAHAGTMAGMASKRRDTSCAAFHSDWAKRAMALEAPDYRLVARKAFDDAYRAEATPTVALG